MRNRSLTLWLVAIVVVAVVVYAYMQHTGSQGSGPGALAGQPAPALPLKDAEGRDVTLDAYRGHIVVINLWATWCPPCRAEMPELQRLYSAYRSRGVIVLGVNQGESAGRATEFARSLGIHFPILLDPNQEYGRRFTALGLPTTVVIDRNGTIVRGYDGPLAYAQMVAAVEPLFTK
ncbi:MAG: TlpA family protein disulfide reductase [Candidatus Eremiobacteraeota bacterium]|nr:TlpA family protein disulfide reductase [Candidatus Eremiobacteraeota bacterium]